MFTLNSDFSLLIKGPKILLRLLKKRTNEKNAHNGGISHSTLCCAETAGFVSKPSRTLSTGSLSTSLYYPPPDGCEEYISSILRVKFKLGTPADILPTQESSTIFRALCAQRWGEIGQGQDQSVAATANNQIMIDRITSILEHRLSDMIRSREATCDSSVQIMNGDGFSLLSKSERDQLHLFVSRIASMYRNVHYHSFEHASHVVISLNELIEMLRSSKDEDGSDGNGVEYCRGNNSSLSDNYLSHFALIFAALVHDVDHYGMSNQILIDRKEKIAIRYNNNSVAEQNSLEIALRMLFHREFDQIRTVIFPTVSEKVKFGIIVFDTILCTDITSKERLKMCKNRWETTFGSIAVAEEDDRGTTTNTDTATSRAGVLNENWLNMMYALDIDEYDIEHCPPSLFSSTQNRLEECVVLEHMMQVADVAHTMQGWDNFIKWNYRFYKELMTVYDLNLGPDPTKHWYSDQIGFYDHYVLPLASRIDQCHVLGDENGRSMIALAKENKERWEKEGKRLSHVIAHGLQHDEDEKEILSQCKSCF